MVERTQSFGRRGRPEAEREEGYDSGGEQEGVNWGRVALVFLAFAILFFVTSWVMGWSAEEKTKTIRASQLYGPIVVTKPRTVYEITLRTQLPRQSWQFIEAELLDAKKEYLFSFSKELYRESGRDSEGSWSETVNSLDMKLTVPAPGQYYLRFKVDGGELRGKTATDLATRTKLTVTVARKLGSSIPHLWVGLIVLIIGLVLNEIGNLTITRLVQRVAEKDDD